MFFRLERMIDMSEPGNQNNPPGGTDAHGEKNVRIRRLIERKMVESWQNKPHFFVTIAVDMTDIIRFRKDLGITINDFILAATAAALKEHPWVNSHWIENEAVEQEHINLAMAVATEGGLYYPVIKNLERLSLKQIGESTTVLAEKAHLGQLSDEDQEGRNVYRQQYGHAWGGVLCRNYHAATGCGPGRGDGQGRSGGR